MDTGLIRKSGQSKLSTKTNAFNYDMIKNLEKFLSNFKMDKTINVGDINIVNPVDFEDVKQKMQSNYSELFSNELRVRGGSIK